MKNFYFTLLAISILFSSCKNNDIETVQANPSNVVPFTQQAASGLQNRSTPVPVSQNHNLFHENNSGTTTSVAMGVNPEHGQPNHRCDVAVGAPLNTPANGSASTQSVNLEQTPVTPTQNSAAPTLTTKGMNPPHGEKNHRCDIAVGAPLNSKPTTTTSENLEQASPKNTLQQPVPALLSTAAATETPSGMNPAHGKEGHRCDIAVGAPFPKS
jgi:hypothetical protein